MTIQKKLSISLIIIVLVLCTIITYIMNSALEYVLFSEEDIQSRTIFKEAEIDINKSIVQSGITKNFFSIYQKQLQSLAHKIIAVYSPTSKNSPSLERYIKEAEKHSIKTLIYSQEGDAILALTKEDSIETIINPFQASLFPPNPKGAFIKKGTFSILLNNTKNNTIAVSYKVFLHKYKVFLVLMQYIDITPILTPLTIEYSISNTLSKYKSLQIIPENTLKENTELTPEMLHALQTFIKQKKRKYIDTSNTENTLYSIGFNSLVKSYVINTQDITIAQQRLDDFSKYSTNICILFAVLSCLFIPAIIKILFAPLQNLITFLESLIEKPLLSSNVDIVMIESAVTSRKGTEFYAIAQSFIKLLTLFNNRQKEYANTLKENRRNLDDLENAGKIKAGLMPNTATYSVHKSFSMNAHLLPNIPVSGEFYDSAILDDTLLYFAVGSVDTINIASSMFMTLTVGLLQSFIRTTKDVTLTLSTVNNILRTKNPLDISVKILIGILNIETGELSYINAGQCQPLLIQNGIMQENTSYVFESIGVTESLYFVDNSIVLQAGDSILLHNEGLIKAQNKDSKAFGIEKLEDIVKEYAHNTTDEVSHEIIQKYHLFCAGKVQVSDALFIYLQYKPHVHQQKLFTTVIGKEQHLIDMEDGKVYT